MAEDRKPITRMSNERTSGKAAVGGTMKRTVAIAEHWPFTSPMNLRVTLLTFCPLLLVLSCGTQQSRQPKIAGWPGLEVFMMPRWTFMTETVELKAGQFRYWFSSDVVIRGRPKYPSEGTYSFKEDELILSSGKVFKVRQINGRRVLFWPHAVEDWEGREIIPGHMLLPVESIGSAPPTIQDFFTKEQIEQSEKKARQLAEKNK
jgi:hypothetical protein